jgi:hypothetical protein
MNCAGDTSCYLRLLLLLLAARIMLATTTGQREGRGRRSKLPVH